MTIYYETPAIGEKIETSSLENDGNEHGLLCVQYFPSFYGKIAEKRRNKKTLEKMIKVLETHKNALKAYKTLESLASGAARFVRDNIK